VTSRGEWSKPWTSPCPLLARLTLTEISALMASLAGPPCLTTCSFLRFPISFGSVASLSCCALRLYPACHAGAGRHCRCRSPVQGTCAWEALQVKRWAKWPDGDEFQCVLMLFPPQHHMPLCPVPSPCPVPCSLSYPPARFVVTNVAPEFLNLTGMLGPSGSSSAPATALRAWVSSGEPPEPFPLPSVPEHSTISNRCPTLNF
jgi:hypothetical protein